MAFNNSMLRTVLAVLLTVAPTAAEAENQECRVGAKCGYEETSLLQTESLLRRTLTQELTTDEALLAHRAGEVGDTQSGTKFGVTAGACKDYTKQYDDFQYSYYNGETFPPNGASDKVGDRCDFYAGDTDQCGEHDDEDFFANEMCCNCGGGSTYTGERSLAINSASVFISEGADCPQGFEPITTFAACRAALDMVGMDGFAYNGADSESNWPKGCYYCKNTANCDTGVWFNEHSTGKTVSGTRRVCHKNYNSSDVKILFVGDSDIDYWDSAPYFPGSFNIGIGGYTTADVFPEVDQWISDLDPEWVVIVCGENDISAGKRKKTKKALKRFTKSVKKFIDDGARVIYLGTKVEPDSKNLYDEYMYYDAELRKFATEQGQGKDKPPFQMIDVFKSFTNTMQNGKAKTSWSELYNSDGLHMSRLGYKFWNAWVRIAMESTTPCIRWSDGVCAEAP
jgi:lysophospholipase L1-like esterase